MNTAPTVWTQYVNSKDCSLGFCTLYCPQWCYIVFPPPPPFRDEFPVRTSPGPNFSPLVITIIGVLAASFLLVSYYAIISKYCIQRNTPTARREHVGDENESIGDNDQEHGHARGVEPWFVPTNGLDEALIRSIAVFKYKKAEGLSQGTDCSVCLSEFEEHDSLRLLPKCSHAFHVPCIDTWLKSRGNCPLCRENVASVEPSPTESLPLEVPPRDETLGHGVINNVVDQITSREIASIDIGDAEDRHEHRYVRRSVSMECIRDHRLPIRDAFGDQRRVLDMVMKRSHSCGRWFLCKSGRQRNSSVIPL